MAKVLLRLLCSPNLFTPWHLYPLQDASASTTSASPSVCFSATNPQENQLLQYLPYWVAMYSFCATASILRQRIDRNMVVFHSFLYDCLEHACGLRCTVKLPARIIREKWEHSPCVPRCMLTESTPEAPFTNPLCKRWWCKGMITRDCTTVKSEFFQGVTRGHPWW